MNAEYIYGVSIGLVAAFFGMSLSRIVEKLIERRGK